jgi:hypothetical protein
MPEDELLSRLLDAIAAEMAQLGYRPCAERGYLERDGEPARLVADDIWMRVSQLVLDSESPS